jgi:hypothetical protein
MNHRPAHAGSVRSRLFDLALRPACSLILLVLAGGIHAVMAEPATDYARAEFYPSVVRAVVFGSGSVLDASRSLTSHISRWKISFGASPPRAVFYPANAQIEIEGLVCSHATLGQKECSITIPTERRICWIMPGKTLEEALANQFKIDCPSALDLVK